MLRPVAFGEHAAMESASVEAGVRPSSSASVTFEPTRCIASCTASISIWPSMRCRPGTGMPRGRDTLVAADSIRDAAERPILAAQLTHSGVLFNEFQALCFTRCFGRGSIIVARRFNAAGGSVKLARKLVPRRAACAGEI